MLVDNAAYSFGYQIDNGVPIIPFYDDKNDKELMHLIVYLQQILELEDVREQNKRAFQLSELSVDDIKEYLKEFYN